MNNFKINKKDFDFYNRMETALAGGKKLQEYAIDTQEKFKNLKDIILGGTYEVIEDAKGNRETPKPAEDLTQEEKVETTETKEEVSRERKIYLTIKKKIAEGKTLESFSHAMQEIYLSEEKNQKQREKDLTNAIESVSREEEREYLQTEKTLKDMQELGLTPEEVLSTTELQRHNDIKERLNRINKIKTELDSREEIGDLLLDENASERQKDSALCNEYLSTHYDFTWDKKNAELYYSQKIKSPITGKLESLRIANNDERALVADIMVSAKGVSDDHVKEEIAKVAVSRRVKFEKEQVEQGLKDNFQPSYRRIKDNQGNIWIDTAYGSRVSGKGNGFIKVDAKTGDWKDQQDLPEEMFFSRSSTVGEMKVSNEHKEIRYISKIFDYVNIAENTRALYLAGMVLPYVIPGGDLPIFIFQGKGGSGKSQGAFTTKQIMDPSDSKEITGGIPDDKGDFRARVKGSTVVIYDNIQGITKSESDIMSGIATGTDFHDRKFFTQDQIVSTPLRAMQILTTVQNLVLLQDFQTRVMRFHFTPLTQETRVTTGKLKSNRERDLPIMRAGLLSLIAEVNKRYARGEADEIDLSSFKGEHRMSDLITLAVMIENILIEENIFTTRVNTLKALENEQYQLSQDSLPDIITFMTELPAREKLEGSPLNILDHLRQLAETKKHSVRNWPTTGQGMARKLEDYEYILSEELSFDVKIKKNGKDKNGNSKFIKRYTIASKDLEGSEYIGDKDEL